MIFAEGSTAATKCARASWPCGAAGTNFSAPTPHTCLPCVTAIHGPEFMAQNSWPIIHGPEFMAHISWPRIYGQNSKVGGVLSGPSTAATQRLWFERGSKDTTARCVLPSAPNGHSCIIG